MITDRRAQPTTVEKQEVPWMLQADGTPIDEGVKHTFGPENLDLMSKGNIDENGIACRSCYPHHKSWKA